jgi:hypothetical protein
MFHLPIKDSGDPLIGTSTKDLYLGLAVIFAYVFLDGDTTKSFKLRASAKAATEKLSKLIRVVVEAVAFGKHLHLHKIFDMGSSVRLLSVYGRHMIERLIRAGKTVEEVVAEIIPTAAGSVATQAQAMAQMLDVYLKEEHMHHWADIRRCAYSDDPEDFMTLQKYALEACRLEPAVFGVMRISVGTESIRDGKDLLEYSTGDSIYTDFVAAGRDQAVFGKNADQIDVTRDMNSYLHHGSGPHSCIGRAITQVSLAVQLGLFAKLKNLKRVPGQAGNLKYTTKLADRNLGSVRAYMTEDWSSWWPFPTSKLPFLLPLLGISLVLIFLALAMKVQHEGFCKTMAEHDSEPVRRNATRGPDTESVCSIRSVGTSPSQPHDFLDDFIAFFGDTLIDRAGARAWAGYFLAQHTPEVIEQVLTGLLKDYAMELLREASNEVEIQHKQPHQVCGANRRIASGAIKLIREYQPIIARYVHHHVVSPLLTSRSMAVRLQPLGKQTFLTENFGLYEKVALDRRGGIEECDDDDEGVYLADLAPIRDFLVSGKAFQNLAVAMRRSLYYDDRIGMGLIKDQILEELSRADPTSCRNCSDSQNDTNGCSDHRLVYDVRFNVKWSLQEFLRSQFENSVPLIGSLIALTGSALYAQATTCSNYLQTTWPRSGSFFLSTLQTTIDSSNTMGEREPRRITGKAYSPFYVPVRSM